MVGVRVAIGLVLATLILCGGRADGAPKDEAPRGAAFLERVAADGEAQAFEQLLTSDEDAWIVAEELLLLGRRDLARRLGAAARAADDGALDDYITGDPRPSQDLASRIHRAGALLADGKARDALAALGDAPEPTLTVTEVRYLEHRARALADLKRHVEVSRILGRLATRAAAIRWRRAEIRAQLAQLERVDPEVEHAAARRILSRLLGLDRDALDLGRSAVWCAQLGELEANHGSARLARTWLLEAESLFDVLSRSPGLTPTQAAERCSAAAALARVHFNLGNVAAGIKTAFRAQDASKALDPECRIKAARAVAYGYHVLARLDDAVTALTEAERLARTARPSDHVRVLGDLARLHLERGDFVLAQKLYDRVLAAMATQDLRTKYVARLHVAGSWIDRPARERHPAKLRRALVGLLDLLQDLEQAPADFAARSEIAANTKAYAGRALNLLGRHGEAIPLLRQAIEEPYAQMVPLMRQYAERELAHALRKKGRAQEAFVLTTRVLAALRERVSNLPGSYALSLLTAPTVDDLIAEHVAAALAQDSPRDLLHALEATRGIVFLAEVRRRKLQGSRAQLGAALNTVAALASEVARSARAFWDARAEGKLAIVRAARRELWDRRLRLRAAEERASLADSGDDAAAPRDSSYARRFRIPPALRDDEAMLYYTLSAEGYIAALAWRDRVHAWPLGARTTVDTALADARDTWIDPVATDVGPALDTLVDAVLPKALRAHFTSKDPPSHVYVSAAGTLATLPWPALIAEGHRRAGGSTDRGPTVSLISSQGVLRYVRTWNPAAADGPVLALGDPDYTSGGPERTQMAFFGGPLDRLAASADEVRALTSPDRGDVLLLASDANEALLRYSLFDAPYPFDVLHLACHGLLFGKTPWMSALAVHATPGDDGLVTVDEIGRWQFRGGPRLVVLAACESGLGAPVPGEGEEGLVRAFLLAGARHVVASFWKVPDEISRDIMVAFHRYRRDQRLAPALALRRAQADVRGAGTGSARRPFGWAGWAVWGPRD